MDRAVAVEPGLLVTGPEPMPPRVADVKVIPNYRLRIAFSTGEIKEYDVKPWLDKGVFKSLRDVAVFAEAYVDLQRRVAKRGR